MNNKSEMMIKLFEYKSDRGFWEHTDTYTRTIAPVCIISYIRWLCIVFQISKAVIHFCARHARDFSLHLRIQRRSGYTCDSSERRRLMDSQSVSVRKWTRKILSVTRHKKCVTDRKSDLVSHIHSIQHSAFFAIETATCLQFHPTLNILDQTKERNNR